MTLVPIPIEITEAVVRHQEKMKWPECVPGFVEFKRGKKELWKRFPETTVADCEQIGEYHIREAQRHIVRWMENGRLGTMRRAARHIFMARALRCRYFTLMGIENSTEAELPFPQLSAEDAARLDAESGDPPAPPTTDT